jgi:hypothetical protein
MSILSNDLDLNVFTNLLTAAAVNKRLLMRVLAHLEKRDLKELHAEVALLNDEFRGTIERELKDLIERHSGRVGELPEEEPLLANASELSPMDRPLSAGRK